MARAWLSAGLLVTLLVAGGVVAAPFIAASDQEAAQGGGSQVAPGEVYRKVLQVGWVAASRAPAVPPLLPQGVLVDPTFENTVEFDVPKGALAIHVEGSWTCIGDCTATMLLAPGGVATMAGREDMRDQAEGDGDGAVHLAHPSPGRWHFSLAPAGPSVDGSGRITVVVYG